MIASKILGIIILLSIFGGLFAFMTYESGIKIALTAFGISIALVCLVAVAVMLLVGQMEPTLIDVQGAFIILGNITIIFFLWCSIVAVVYVTLKGLLSLFWRLLK